MQTNVVDATTERGDAADAMRRGIAAAQAGNKAAAHDIFQQLASTHPSEAEVWVWLGGTSQDLDEAELAFSRAHSLDPSNEEAALGLRWVTLRRPVNAQSATLFAPVEAPAYKSSYGAAVPAPEPAPTAAGAGASEAAYLGEEVLPYDPNRETSVVSEQSRQRVTSSASRRGLLSLSPGKALIILAIICYLIIFAWLLTNVPR
ncbi:MAG: hypothetical protein IVW55_01350 [Chloroflexi bacterium]|nr:hypothetical protein [Chloroflexota bacterium]